MKMQRFVLTYTGEGTMPTGDINRLNEQITVVEQRHQSLLVEDAPAHLSRLLLTMPRWQAGPEQIPRPQRLESRFPLGIHHRLWVVFLIVLGLLIYFSLSCQR